MADAGLTDSVNGCRVMISVESPGVAGTGMYVTSGCPEITEVVMGLLVDATVVAGIESGTRVEMGEGTG